MEAIPVRIGDLVHFEKTVSESDVYLFAGITGDLNANHVNEAYMKKTIYGRRIAHGALMLGYISTASTKMIDLGLSRSNDFVPVALGYDKVRFLAPVFLGDTITVEYAISEVDGNKSRTLADIKITTHDQRLAVVAKHHLKWLPAAQQADG